MYTTFRWYGNECPADVKDFRVDNWKLNFLDINIFCHLLFANIWSVSNENRMLWIYLQNIHKICFIICKKSIDLIKVWTHRYERRYRWRSRSRRKCWWPRWLLKLAKVFFSFILPKLHSLLKCGEITVE